jgi:two-component system response regulator YesN
MNILIIDDQVRVVNGLLKGIDWNRIGITNVYKAYNVFEAKALFNNISIDLLLTDIEMPGENGIDLVHWIREHNFDTESIFLTSHANFEYAQEAIRTESFDYILQPCPYNEIQTTLSKAVYKINQKREQQKFSHYGKMAVNDNSIKMLMLHDCLKLQHNTIPLKILKSLDTFQNMNTQGYLSLFQISNSDTLSKQWDINLVEFTLQNVINEVFEPLCLKVILANMDSFTFAFLSYSPVNNTISSQIYLAQLNLLKELFYNMFHFSVVFYTTGILTEVSNLHEQYQILEQLKNNNITKQNECLQIVPSHQNEKGDENPDRYPVKTIINYLKEHLEEDITRQDLANLVHFNVDYLSRMFKKETGYTLNDYITNEKMQLAKNLIQTTILPIGLIATKVGYSNFSYFSKIYKKTIGISPMDDRNNNKSNR